MAVMCGRFLQTTPPHLIAERFGVEPSRILLREWLPQYNLAPSRNAMVVRPDLSGRRSLRLNTWGLLPHWSKAAKFPYSTINARAETVHNKPAFRDAFHHRRCLVPCDGYYEWVPVGKIKQPYLIRLKAEGPFALAGLWEHWEGLVEGMPREIESFTIVVTQANELTRNIHDRMPVILPEAEWQHWLDPDTPVDVLRARLQPYPPEEMRYWAVSRRVGSPAVNDPELIRPIEP